MINLAAYIKRSVRQPALELLALLCVLCGAAGAKDVYGLDGLITGADAFGRGGAYLAAAEDSSSFVFQNYAALGRHAAPRAALTAFKLISEVNYLAAAYSQGGWGLGFLTIQETGGYVRDASNHVTGGQIGFNDATLYGAYGWSLASGRLDLGVRVKYLNKSFSEIEASAWGLALDLSALYQAGAYWTIGAEINNALATPLQWSNDLAETLPLGLGLGGRFKAFGPEGLWSGLLKNPLDMYLDVYVENADPYWGGGVEYRPGRYIALRAGFKESPTEQDGKAGKLLKFVAGVGFNWHNIYFDYAYNPGDDLAENITHFFTLSYRFEQPAKTPPPAPVPARERIFYDTTHLPVDEQVLIEDLGYLGFVYGYPPGNTYGPELPMTRKELMLVLVRLLESEGRYPDGARRWFEDATDRTQELIEKVTSYGLLRGYTDGLARLEQPVRRDEAASAFARYYQISGQELQSADRYIDVPPNHWGYKDINLTKHYRLTQGIDHVHYLPRAYLVRRDAARIVGRVQYVRDSRKNLPPVQNLSEFLPENTEY